MELRESLAALRASWWLPFVGLVAGASAALAITLTQPPLYTASTQLFVSTSDTASTSDVFQGSQFSEGRVTSYARLIGGNEIAKRVIDRLGLGDSPTDLRSRIDARAIADTVLIDVTVSDPSPDGARLIADAIGDEFTVFVLELETPDGGGESPVKVTVTDEPERPMFVSSPNTTRNVAAGGVVGLLFGTSLAVLRARMDRSVKSPADVAESTSVPVIGTVLQDETIDRQHVVVGDASSRSAESFRQLRTNLQFLSVDDPPKIIMVSSAVPSEGKTTVVVNLALALVDAGHRVTVIEADLRKPKVTRYLGMVGGAGLTNVLAGTADLDDVTQVYGEGGLRVIAAGPTPPNPGELLSSSQMSDLVERMRMDNDFVLVDAPPLLPVADSSGLAVRMDGVLLSVRYGSTTKEQLRQAATTLERVGAKALGVILNIVPPKAELASAYGYGYSYRSEGEQGSA